MLIPSVEETLYQRHKGEVRIQLTGCHWLKSNHGDFLLDTGIFSGYAGLVVAGIVCNILVPMNYVRTARQIPSIEHSAQRTAGYPLPLNHIIFNYSQIRPARHQMFSGV